MIQVFFFIILIVSLLGGLFAYYAPSQKPLNPMKFVMDSSGYNTLETSNQKKFEQISTITNQGITHMRRRMDEVAVRQSQLLSALKDQQQILVQANRDAQSVLREARSKGVRGTTDLLRLEGLASDIQNQDRILTSQGQQLVSLNNQLAQNRELLAAEFDQNSNDTKDAMSVLQQRADALSAQANGYFEKVNRYNALVQDQIERMQNKINNLASTSMSNSADQQQMSQQRLQDMVDHERENMAKLEDSEQKAKQVMAMTQQKIADSNERAAALMQQNKDALDVQRQRLQDQNAVIKQKIADEEQHLKDQQALLKDKFTDENR